VYLVHIGEAIIERVLRRLRELEKLPGATPKKPKLSITCDDSHRLPQPSGACLKQAIENHVPDGYDKYVQWKGQLLKTLGYEDGPGRLDVTISTSPDTDSIDTLLDLSLGLRKSVKVVKFTAYDTRFGISCPIPGMTKEGGELSTATESLKATVSFRERKSAPSIDFPASLYNPSINSIIPRERARLRLQAQFFDILLEPFKGTAKFTFSADSTSAPARLPDLRDFLTLLCMLSVRGSQGVRMELMVGDQVLLPEGKLSMHQSMPNPRKELGTVERALAVARAYNVEQRVSTTIAEIMKLRRPMEVFYNLVENPSGELTATFFVDGPIESTDSGGAIVRARVPLGDYSLYCVFGMVGRLVQIGEKQYKLTSRERSFHKRVLKERNAEIDDPELADLVANVEREMEAIGVNQVVALSEWWGA
jgi:hypothetical protein